MNKDNKRTISASEYIIEAYMRKYWASKGSRIDSKQAKD